MGSMYLLSNDEVYHICYNDIDIDSFGLEHGTLYEGGHSYFVWSGGYYMWSPGTVLAGDVTQKLDGALH
jgi:hypothetical protein